jgi:hypothetical protein
VLPFPASRVSVDAPGQADERPLRQAAHAVPSLYPVRSPLARSAPGERPVRLTRRGYGVVGALALAAVAGLLWLAHASALGVAPATPRPPAVVTVHDGDTLWSIASRIAPQSDPREVVARLERVNGLADPMLQAGQQLRTG